MFNAGPDQVIPVVGFLGASIALVLLFWGTISRKFRPAEAKSRG